jgi:hypothetical protein
MGEMRPTSAAERGGDKVFDPIISRRLSVSLDPGERRAAVEIRAPGGGEPYAVTVEPAAAGDGWLVTDPSDPEPTWRATLDAAVDEAIAVAASVLAERIGRELSACAPGAAGRPARGAADIC